HLVADPGGDLVQHPGAEVAAAVQLCLVRRPPGADPPVHRLLQPDDGQADPVALLTAAESRRRVRAGIGRHNRLATWAAQYSCPVPSSPTSPARTAATGPPARLPGSSASSMITTCSTSASYSIGYAATPPSKTVAGTPNTSRPYRLNEVASARNLLPWYGSPEPSKCDGSGEPYHEGCDEGRGGS